MGITNLCRASRESHDQIYLSTGSNDGSGVDRNERWGSFRPGQEALYAGDPALPKVVLLKPAVRDGAITNTFLAWVGFARIESFKTSMYF